MEKSEIFLDLRCQKYFIVEIVSLNLATTSNFVEFRDSRNFTFFEASWVVRDTWHMWGGSHRATCHKGVSQTKVQVMAICHKLRGGKSKSLDKEIRGNPIEPIGRCNVAKRTSHLTHLGPNSVGVKRKKKRERRKKEKRGRGRKVER